MSQSKLREALLSLSVSLLLLSPALSRAQNSGVIRGTITDQSGAAVVGAKVTVRETETGFSRSMPSSDMGAYLLSSMQAGDYVVSVEKSGFRKLEQAGVLLAADQAMTLNFVLQPGAVSETVQVNAVSPLVDTSTPTIATVIDQERIDDLPLNGRNPAFLVSLLPGVVFDNGAGVDVDQGDTKTFPGAEIVSANGTRENDTTFLLDGSLDLDIWTDVNLPFPFPDAVREFSAQTSNYSAAYGQNSGGVVNAITRSGTDKFHGDAFEYVRNAVFNAKDYFSQTSDQLKRNQFGVTLGGPVVLPPIYNGHGHTYFFAGYQGTRIREAASENLAYIPTAAEMNGDFSAYPFQLYDPNGNPYSNNQIPTASFDPVAKEIVNNYLPPLSTNTSNYYTTAFYTRQVVANQDEFIARGDHSFGDKGRLILRYDLNRYHHLAPYSDHDLLSYANGSTLIAHNAMINEGHSLTPNLWNDARFGFVRIDSRRDIPAGVPTIKDLGANVWNPDNLGIRWLQIDGYFQIGGFSPSAFVRDLFSWVDDVTWVHGRNTITFGGNVERARVNIVNPDYQAPYFRFNANPTGDSMVSFLLGRVRNLTQDNGYQQNGRGTFLGFYGQDAFKVNSRLMMTAGLRYEPWLAWGETHGRLMTFDPQAYYMGVHSEKYPNAPAGLLFPGDSGFPANGVKNRPMQLSPRVGFALDAFGNGKTSIRGGAGLFYNTRINGNTNIQDAQEVPFTYKESLAYLKGPLSDPYQGLTNPFPATWPPPSTVTFPSQVEETTFDVRNGYKVSLLYNWNLGIEHQFTRNWMARASYVGTHGSHLTETVDYNPSTYDPNDLWNEEQHRMFQGYTDIWLDQQAANSNYNALQTMLEHRFDNRFTVMVSYTYSKSLDTLPFAGGAVGVPNGNSISPLPWYYPNFHRFDYGPSEFDYTHVLSVSYVLKSPKLVGAPLLVRQLLGSWQLSGIVAANSGTSLTLLAGNDYSQVNLCSSGYICPDRAFQVSNAWKLRGSCAGIPSCFNWINPSAFTDPALGTFGNTGKGAFRGPGYINSDIGAAKDFPFNERIGLQFRADFFNVFNHVNLVDPDTTVDDPSFGQIQGGAPPRVGQLALKLTF